jgi:hypothetical protein
MRARSLFCLTNWQIHHEKGQMSTPMTRIGGLDVQQENRFHPAGKTFLVGRKFGPGPDCFLDHSSLKIAHFRISAIHFPRNLRAPAIMNSEIFPPDSGVSIKARITTDRPPIITKACYSSMHTHICSPLRAAVRIQNHSHRPRRKFRFKSIALTWHPNLQLPDTCRFQPYS